MSLDTAFGGTAITQLVNLTGTSATELISDDSSELLIHSVAYASAAGDTLTLDTHDGSTASRLRQAIIAANGDGAFDTPFLLARSHALRGTLAAGNATAVRVTYTVKNG